MGHIREIQRAGFTRCAEFNAFVTVKRDPEAPRSTCFFLLLLDILRRRAR